MNEWFDHPFLLLILIVLNFPIYRILMEEFFGDIGNLKDSVWYWFTPDIISVLKGEFLEDKWAELKLGFYIGACSSVVAAEYIAISKLIVWLQK